MTDYTREQIEGMLAGATSGRRVQFHPSYCPEAEGTPFSEWDTSHDMSVIRPDGSRYKLAHYRHADDAALSQAAPDLARQLLAALYRVEALGVELAAAGVKGMPAPPMRPPTREEQIAQGKRCRCRGSDDMCVCQNVPDRETIKARAALGGSHE